MSDTSDDIRARALELLLGKEEYLSDNSQFLNEISTILGVGVDMSRQESHSDRNEFFTETAQLESSLLAKASDEGRIPNRPLPQIIRCSVKCDGYQEFNEDSVFGSEINTKYLVSGIVVVDNGTVYATFRQEEKKSYSYIPTAEEWQEFVVGGKKTSRFHVYVNSNLWEDYENIGDLVDEGYVTRYNILDQLYIRTGNGFLGKIPDGQIDIVSYDTEAKDIQVGAPLYAEGVDQNIEITVTEIIQSSQPQESAISVAKSLPFWRLKQGGSGYDSDYIDDIKAQFPEALSIKVWGEKKESASYDRDNINIIFVSALRKENQATFGYEVIAFLKAKKYIMQVQFEWREPILIDSGVSITGKIERTKNIDTCETSLRTEIAKYYSLYADKAYRKQKIYKSNLNAIIKATGVFDNLLPNKSRNDEPEYDYMITGSQVPATKREIVYIPDENISIDIEQVDNA